MRASSEELITFVTVVESGSFSRAAEQLGQDNSVVSRTLKRLEQKLGITLLNRTTRRLELTARGAAYHGDMVAILAAIEPIAERHLQRALDAGRA